MTRIEKCKARKETGIVRNVHSMGSINMPFCSVGINGEVIINRFGTFVKKCLGTQQNARQVFIYHHCLLKRKYVSLIVNSFEGDLASEFNLIPSCDACYRDGVIEFAQSPRDNEGKLFDTCAGGTTV